MKVILTTEFESFDEYNEYVNSSQQDEVNSKILDSFREFIRKLDKYTDIEKLVTEEIATEKYSFATSREEVLFNYIQNNFYEMFNNN